MTTNQKASQAGKRAKPVTEVREGTVRIPIWQNASDKGPYWTIGQPENAYLDGDKWVSSKRFSEFDAECAALAFLQARKFVRQLRRELKKDTAETAE